jgi:hypothetical protein
MSTGTHELTLTDDDVERIARFSILDLDRSSPNFHSIKRDLESVGSLLLLEVKSSSSQHLDSMDAKQIFERADPSNSAAALRIASLRLDDEVSGGSLGHAIVEGGYYKAQMFD